MSKLILGGCRADTLAGYLQALGVLRVLSRQKDAAARLHWTPHDAAVLTTSVTADELVAWLVDDYAPSPIVSPWNAGSGFAANGKSATAEKILEEFRASSDPRFAPLRQAIEVADRVVATGRASGWAGSKFWTEEHKADIVRLCRRELPDDALAWLDVAVTLTSADLRFSPLTGTGGNFGRQDLSATFLQRLALVAGPKAKTGASADWAKAALFGQEDVPYLRDTVGQYDPGRAGGILSSPQEKSDDTGFTNPWALILTLEGTLLFASAVTRRYSALTDAGSLPFFTHNSAVGYASSADGETVKGEQWVPLWQRPASLSEIEALIGEGRAQWRGRQARTGLEFAMAISALGVNRGLSAFRRFVIASRLGQNPLAVPIGRLEIRSHPEERLIRDPYDWVQRLKRISLPGGIVTAVRRVEREMFGVAAGEAKQALRRFVVEFGRLHAMVARSGSVRQQIAPFQPRTGGDWLKALEQDDELWIAAGFAGLRDPEGTGLNRSARALLTRVQEKRLLNGRIQLIWSDRAAIGLELNGATLPRALAEGHRRRVLMMGQSSAQRDDDPDLHGPQPAYPFGQWLPVNLLERFALGELDDDLIAGYLGGLLALGLRTTTEVSLPRPGDRRRPLHPAVAALMPFYGTDPLRVRPLVRQGQEPPPPVEVRPSPRPDWVARLIVSGVISVADEVLLRLRLAGCPPVVTAQALGQMPIDGTRLAGALLLRVPPKARARALRSVCAVQTNLTAVTAESVLEGTPA